MTTHDLDPRIPTVVHVYGELPWDEYIGRYMGRQGHEVLPASIWANYFHIGYHGTRAQVLTKYEQRIRYALEHGEGVPTVEAIRLLEGATLACWCAKKDQRLTINDPFVCHGQIVAKLFKEYILDRQ